MHYQTKPQRFRFFEGSLKPINNETIAFEQKFKHVLIIEIGI
jgi:hypothetical protein